MERLELSQDYSHTLLKRARLPFRHIGKYSMERIRDANIPRAVLSEVEAAATSA